VTGNDVTSEVDAVVNVVLSRAEKHVPYEQLVRTTKCVDASDEVSHTPRSSYHS
jgi:hypothetical protein